MNSAFVLLFLITGQLLLTSNGVLGSCSFGAGMRIEGDQLLLKDVQHSRPADTTESANVVFKYNIEEPITYIEIASEENISAEVQFSYSDTLIVGKVRLVYTFENESSTIDDDESGENFPDEFDVIIRIFGYNDTMLNLNPALLLNRGTQYVGQMIPYYNLEKLIKETTEGYDEFINSTDYEVKDKTIEIGERQAGDDLIYETYQTSPDTTKMPSNHTLVFYYIDSTYITYVKFVIFDHFSDKVSTAENYKAPVAEYSHYSPGSLKATITDFNITSMFAQMFIYGYRGRDSVPPDYKPFLPPPHYHRMSNNDVTTSSLIHDIQLSLLRGGLSTQSPDDYDDADDADEDDMVEHSIRPEDMVPDHVPEARSIPNAALVQQGSTGQRLYAMLGLMLFAVA
ncbi:uncharacterized protein LOC117791319 [Drosophila innubila]|uniref:uncharacterized protein LOC117791319 n=1 Tax=Drosophila innubila TaxID=198719 RepID=UPI00148C6889|nr:uncharacterized protein LOC117791319 [Drosophila innubila]